MADTQSTIALRVHEAQMHGDKEFRDDLQELQDKGLIQVEN